MSGKQTEVAMLQGRGDGDSCTHVTHQKPQIICFPYIPKMACAG